MIIKYTKEEENLFEQIKNGKLEEIKSLLNNNTELNVWNYPVLGKFIAAFLPSCNAATERVSCSAFSFFMIKL